MTESVLVSGGAGYIGSHVVLALIDAGRHVVVVDNLSTGARSLVPNDVELVVKDAGNAEAMARLIQDKCVDSVIHLAGSIVVSESVERPLEYFFNNTAVSAGIIGACVQTGVKRFVFSSTAAVYGDRASPSQDDRARPNPVNPYGRSKLMTEWMLSDVSQAHGLQYAALRYFNVAGADPQRRAGQVNSNATHLIKVCLQAALGKRPYVEVFGSDYETPDGTCLRDYVHVSDIANAHVVALDYLRDTDENVTADIGYGHGYSVREVIAAVERVAGRKIDVRVGPRRKGDAPSVVADGTKACRTLGWIAKYADLDTIVESALNWEKKLDGNPRRNGNDRAD